MQFPRASLSWIIAVGVVTSAGFGSAPALALATPPPWRIAGMLPGDKLTGVSCASGLCVATGSAGEVITSTDPRAGPNAWTPVAIDPGIGLTSIACPATNLCVATDAQGDLLTSTDPSGGASAWSRAAVEVGQPLTAVSCPSSSVCVSVSGRDLLVSSDPSAGAASWRVYAGADQAVGPECGKYGGDSGCAVSLTGVACSSTAFCEAVDDQGGMVRGEPLTGTWGSEVQAPGAPLIGPACITNGDCLTLCGVGVGLDGNCPGNTYDATDLCDLAFCFRISNEGANGLWCQGSRDCFAAVNSDLIAATNPTGGTRSWTTLYRSPSPIASSISGVSCPSSSLCVAVTNTGELLTGGPLPEPPAIQRALRRELAPRLTPTARRLLRERGLRYSIVLPAAARLTVTWDVRLGPHRMLKLGSGAARFTASGTKTFRLRLTARGMDWVRLHPHGSLTARAKLDGAGAGRVMVTRTIGLRAG